MGKGWGGVKGNRVKKWDARVRNWTGDHASWKETSRNFNVARGLKGKLDDIIISTKQFHVLSSSRTGEKKKERKIFFGSLIDSFYNLRGIDFIFFLLLLLARDRSITIITEKRSVEFQGCSYQPRGMRPQPSPRVPLPFFVPSHPSCFWIHGRKSFLSHDTGVGNPPGGQAYPVPAKLPRTQIKSADVRRRVRDDT